MTRGAQRLVCVEDPPGYFRVTSTGTIHLVRELWDMRYKVGPAVHWSIRYWCSNISNPNKGQLSSNRPYEGVDCLRCSDAKTGRRNLSRRRHDRPDQKGARRISP